MKGTLINKEGKWFVQYNEPLSIYAKGYNPGDYVSKELPLHPDDLEGRGYLINNAEVKFEIVEIPIHSSGVQSGYDDFGKTEKYAKLIQPESITREVVQEAMKAVFKDVRKPKAVRDGLIQPKEDEAEQWDKIRNELAILCNGKNEQYEFLSWSRLVFIFDYLKEHYNVPTKKK